MRENGKPRRRRESRSSSTESVIRLRHRFQSLSPSKKHNEEEGAHYGWWFVAFALCFALPSPISKRNPALISDFSTRDNARTLRDKGMFFTPDYSDEHFFDAFKSTRAAGLRWRADAEWLAQGNRPPSVTLMPILVQQPPNIQPHLRQHSLPSSSRVRDDEPSLEEIELIDVLWRSDLVGVSEKGPALERQEESDLAALTHKSIAGPLSQDDASRYEELSKGYFDDFYAGSTSSALSCQSSVDFEGKCYTEGSLPSCSNPVSPLQPQSDLSKSDLPTPTDAELDALFNDMLHKDSSLENLGFPHVAPLMHNVSLNVPIPQSNLTEAMPQMNFACETSCGVVPSVGVVPATPSIQASPFNGTHFWTNHTDGNLSGYLRTDGLNNLTMAVQQMCHSEPVLAEIGAVSGYPTTTQPNVASLQVPYSQVPTGGLYDNFESRRSLSISNESSVDSSSTSSSTSPRYNSETENHSPNQSRFYGKLLPNPMEEQDKYLYDKSRIPMVCSVVPRRRGRQSKDEQLAMAYRLPASAAHISDMSLPELQKMLRSEDLTEEQKTLIRKIRRRGKNKVAARTCRQRRGEMKGPGSIESPMSVNNHLSVWNQQSEPTRTLFRRQ